MQIQNVFKVQKFVLFFYSKTTLILDQVNILFFLIKEYIVHVTREIVMATNHNLVVKQDRKKLILY